MSNIGDFDTVESGSSLDYPSSPDLRQDLDFRGIRIAGPDQVDLEGKPDRRGGFARMMVSGSYHLDSNYLGLEERFRDHLLIVAVSSKTHRAFIGRIPGIPNPYPGKDVRAGMQLSPQDWDGRSIIEFFNANLVSMFGLPQQEAAYIVYATLGKYVSNVVRMRLV